MDAKKRLAEKVSCSCGVPPGSTYFHCRSCCSTYQNLTLFDLHRDEGKCWDLEGVTKEDGIYGTPEGHEKRRTLSARFSSAARRRS